MPGLSITIAITTHNRLEDLARTLHRLRRFAGGFTELIVCADGCDDGTQAYLRESFPEVILLENSPGMGSIPSRNRMIRTAQSSLVLLLDDDSHPEQNDFFGRVTEIMEANPEIGVLTFPQRSDEFPETLVCKDFGPNQKVGTFTSSGAVIRRDLFLSLGGFPEFFFHAYEEPDFSLRVHAQGYSIVQWNRLSVRHYFTGTMRDEGRTHRRHARNEFWSTLMRAPLLLVPPMLMVRVCSQGRYAAGRGVKWLVREPLWWWAAAKGISEALRHRDPVDLTSYRSWLALLRRPEVFKDKVQP